MELLNFIKSHKDWEEILSKSPYALKISRDNGYVMFKYNQIESDFGYQLVREARGVILREKDWKVVCRPFDKFFNYGEVYAAEIDWSHVKVTEKIDGSLIKLWNDNGEWHWSTNGTIDARKAVANDALGITFYDLILRALEKNNRYLGEFYDEVESVHGARSKTFMFEVVSPVSRVVIPYENYDIFYLGVRSNENGEYEEWPIFEEMRPREWNFNSIEEVINAANNLTWMKEGYVVFDGVNRVKVKSPLYVEAHYMRSNGAVSLERLIKVVLDHEEDEFLIYCPEYTSKIERIKFFLKVTEENAEKLRIYFRDAVSFIETKRVLTIHLQSYIHKKYWDFIYKNWDRDFTLTWKEYTKDWDAAKYVRYYKDEL